MKRILKVSILVALFMAMFTIACNAATVNYNTNSDGSVDVTIICEGDIDDAVKAMFESANYTVNVAEKKATYTYTNVTNGPKFRYFEFEDICVATPYTMSVGNSRTIEAPSTITNTTDASVVEITDGKKYTAKKAGEATITINANNSEHPNEIYELKITVVDDSVDPDPVDSDYTATYDGRKLVVSGLLTGNVYRCAVDNDATKDYSSSLTTYILSWDQGDYISESTPADLMQLNQDLYAHIYTTLDNINYTKVTDIKITKPTFNNYNYFSGLSHSAKTSTQLLFDLPYNLNREGMERKIHYKIGRISDDSILRLFKNGDATGFAKLMEYAQNDSNPLYDQTQSPTYSNGYHTNEEIIPGTNLSDKVFYYLYAELDDENGKYIPLKSVTLAQADVYPAQDHSWYLFFYGSKELNFDGITDPTTPEEGEKLPDRLANTGEKALVFALIGITAIVSVVLFKKIKATKIK